jgi:hypothetical protein
MTLDKEDIQAIVEGVVEQLRAESEERRAEGKEQGNEKDGRRPFNPIKFNKAKLELDKGNKREMDEYLFKYRLPDYLPNEAKNGERRA